MESEARNQNNAEGNNRAKLIKRTIKRSKSVMDILMPCTGSYTKQIESHKAKNIKQTEVMISLRDTILRVANYFYTADPNCMPEDPEFLDELQADYSPQSHAKVHIPYRLPKIQTCGSNFSSSNCSVCQVIWLQYVLSN